MGLINFDTYKGKKVLIPSITFSATAAAVLYCGLIPVFVDVNQNDLKWALNNEIIAGAAIDVYDVEPVQDKDLTMISSLINTPHIGGNAIEAVEAMGQSAINNIVNHVNS